MLKIVDFYGYFSSSSRCFLGKIDGGGLNDGRAFYLKAATQERTGLLKIALGEARLGVGLVCGCKIHSVKFGKG